MSSSGNFFHPLGRVYGMLGRFECVNSSHMGFRCLIIWSLCTSMNRSITLYSCLTLYPNSFFLLVTSSSNFSLFYEWFAGISTLSTPSLLLQFMFTWVTLILEDHHPPTSAIVIPRLSGLTLLAGPCLNFSGHYLLVVVSHWWHYYRVFWMTIWQKHP